MTCAWDELLRILPQRVRAEAMRYEGTLQEIRMRRGRPTEYVTAGGFSEGKGAVTADELAFCVNAASRYSPWTAETLSQGYITAPGGHRIGVCGEAIVKDGVFAGVRSADFLCIRVARDYEGIAERIPLAGQALLILGAPGWGKTTLLRDLARRIARDRTVAVVDERRELFPPGFSAGKRMDILSGCPKQQGIEIVLKAMSPEYIAVDEITSEADCAALIAAFGCGVRLLATAHASSMDDFCRRTINAPLLKSNLFDSFLILHRDKSFHMEEYRS